MFKFFIAISLFVYSVVAWSESAVPETKINHAWVHGVYWNPDELPGWGFFVDVQEQSFFGAIYGYLGSDSTFVTLQGNVSQVDPLEFSGNVYFVTNGGQTVTDVGNFTWKVRYYEATPSAFLTISSNIINATNLNLVRLSYVEIDKIDILTGADWNLVEHILITFGDNYRISDERIELDGIIYAAVTNNDDDDDIGAVAYYPPSEGEMYAMLVPLDEDTNNFFAFFATDKNMFGRYWLLDEGETPTGNGYYFHGAIATLQDANDNAGVGLTKGATTSLPQSDHNSASKQSSVEDIATSKKLSYRNAEQLSEPMFSQDDIKSVYTDLLDKHRNGLTKTNPKN